MQIVIDIREEDYKTIKSNYENGFTYKPFGIIANGTPLPKGHGDLIDRKKLIESPLCKTFGLRRIDIENAPTIIEADTESEE